MAGLSAGTKRTCEQRHPMSANDPQRTLGSGPAAGSESKRQSYRHCVFVFADEILAAVSSTTAGQSDSQGLERPCHRCRPSGVLLDIISTLFCGSLRAVG